MTALPTAPAAVCFVAPANRIQETVWTSQRYCPRPRPARLAPHAPPCQALHPAQTPPPPGPRPRRHRPNKAPRSPQAMTHSGSRPVGTVPFSAVLSQKAPSHPGHRPCSHRPPGPRLHQVLLALLRQFQQSTRPICALPRRLARLPSRGPRRLAEPPLQAAEGKRKRCHGGRQRTLRLLRPGGKTSRVWGRGSPRRVAARQSPSSPS